MKEHINGETHVTNIIHKSINDYVIDIGVSCCFKTAFKLTKSIKQIAQLGMRRVIALLDLIHKSLANEEYGSKVSLVSEKGKRGLLSLISRKNEDSFVPPHYPFKR